MREMTDKDMSEKLREFRLELSKEMGSSEIGTVKNPGRIKELRKTIARMLTETKTRGVKKK